MKLLLHVCCGPCSCDLLSRLTADNIIPIPYWYNPNIHPFTEYDQRLRAVDSMCTESNIDIIRDDDYDLDLFFSTLAGNYSQPDRCRRCYDLRLDRAAEQARRTGADAFSTSLLVSPRQFHDQVRAAGEACANKHDIPFFYQDLRPHYQAAVTESKRLGLYRQQYCGCIFSERDRYHQINRG